MGGICGPVSHGVKSDDIKVLCWNHEGYKVYRRSLPYFKNQMSALHTCNVLDGELAFPKTSNEYKTWNGNNAHKDNYFNFHSCLCFHLPKY